MQIGAQQCRNIVNTIYIMKDNDKQLENIISVSLM